MKSPLLLALVVVVAVGAVIGIGLLTEEDPKPHEVETFKYTISAEDIKQYNEAHSLIWSARITITLDHAPETPLDIVVGTEDASGFGGVVVTISDTSASYVIPRNQSGMEWEEGRIWDPGYTARFSGTYAWKVLEKA